MLTCKTKFVVEKCGCRDVGMPGKLDRSWSVLKLRVPLEGRCPIKQFKKLKKKIEIENIFRVSME